MTVNGVVSLSSSLSETAFTILGYAVVGKAPTEWLAEQFRDPTQRLPRTIQAAHEQTWNLISREIRPSVFEKIRRKIRWHGRDEERFAGKLRAMLESDRDLLANSRLELHTAEQSKLIPTKIGDVLPDREKILSSVEMIELANGTWDRLRQSLEANHLTRLARLLGPHREGETAFGISLMAYFLRQELRADEVLCRELVLDKLDDLAHGIHEKLDAISKTVTRLEDDSNIDQLPIEMVDVKKLPGEFLAKEQENDAFRTAWSDACNELVSLLESALAEFRDTSWADRANSKLQEADFWRNQLQAAHDNLGQVLRKPIVYIALTGTTSSGKSTTINLLCGAEIMPVAVGEMSAGAVQIRHSTERKLILRATQGREKIAELADGWKVGPDEEWINENPTDRQIYDILERLMDRYNRLRDEKREPACPQIELFYPTRLGVKGDVLQLPDVCEYVLIDLPGLKYINDKGNSEIIQRFGRHSLCIVLYDAGQPDTEKQRELLQQIVEQVKKLGGSPARMLFVLNRIDKFLFDRNSDKSENIFVEKTMKAIRTHLRANLPGYDAEIDGLHAIKLSSLPAFLAQTAIEEPTHRLAALRKISQSFGNMMPEKYDDESRNPDKWSRGVKMGVAQSIWAASHGGAFYGGLRIHVSKHLPDLVIPQALEAFRASAGDEAKEWLTRTIQAEIHSTKERYLLEKQRLEELSSRLHEMRSNSDAELRAPFEKIRLITSGIGTDEVSRRQAIEGMRDTLQAFQRTPPYNELPVGSLDSLYRWHEALGVVVGHLLGEVQSALLHGRPIRGSTYQRLAPGTRSGLHDTLTSLQASGFMGSTAEKGERIETHTQVNQNRIENLQRALRDFEMQLRPALQNLIHDATQNEMSHVFDAMDRLFAHHAQHVANRAATIVREAGLEIGLELPEPEFRRVEREIVPDFEVQAKLSSGSHSVVVGKRQEVAGTHIETRRVRREWAIDRFFRGEYREEQITVTDYRTVDVSETRSYVDIPSAATLAGNWLRDASRRDSEIIRQLAEWLLEQADMVCRSIADYQQEMLAKYQEELDKAHAVARERSEREESRWRLLEERVKKLSEQYSRFALPTKKGAQHAVS